MPRIIDLPLLPDVDIDDLQPIWDQSADIQGVIYPGRIPALEFASLPIASNSFAGWLLFVTDGRKSGEGAAAGTGILAVFDGTDWVGVKSEVTVTT